MGTLLDFASAPRPGSRHKPRRAMPVNSTQTASGEVILFPGVRYEPPSLDLAARIATIGLKAGPGSTDKN